MSELRVLANAELDMVSAGAKIAGPQPIQSLEPIVVRLVEEIIVDILKVLEGNNGRQKA